VFFPVGEVLGLVPFKLNTAHCLIVITNL
jgi:hypothetical protein